MIKQIPKGFKITITYTIKIGNRYSLPEGIGVVDHFVKPPLFNNNYPNKSFEPWVSYYYPNNPRVSPAILPITEFIKIIQGSY